MYYCVKYRGSLLDCSWQWHHHSVITLVWRQKTDDHFSPVLDFFRLICTCTDMYIWKVWFEYKRTQLPGRPFSTCYIIHEHCRLHYLPWYWVGAQIIFIIEVAIIMIILVVLGWWYRNCWTKMVGVLDGPPKSHYCDNIARGTLRYCLTTHMSHHYDWVKEILFP